MSARLFDRPVVRHSIVRHLLVEQNDCRTTKRLFVRFSLVRHLLVDKLIVQQKERKSSYEFEYDVLISRE